MRSGSLWQQLGRLDGREAISLAIGGAAPMIVAWFLGAVLWTYWGPPDGREGTWRWAGFIPYPDPFTWRSAAGVMLMLGLPLAFLAVWKLARRSFRAQHVGTG